MLDNFQSGEVQVGHSVELPCVASGYPNPTIRWLKDGRPLPSDSRWTRRISGLTVSDLRLEDSGNYICEVTNSFGSKEVAGHLNIIGGSRPSLPRLRENRSDSRRGGGGARRTEAVNVKSGRVERRRTPLFKSSGSLTCFCIDLCYNLFYETMNALPSL